MNSPSRMFREKSFTAKSFFFYFGFSAFSYRLYTLLSVSFAMRHSSASLSGRRKAISRFSSALK